MMPEHIGPAHDVAHEAERAEHQTMMARIEILDQASRLEHGANRLEHEANRAEHAAMMTRIEALDQANRQEHEANRAEHKAIMTQLSRLGRELAKLGVEFEQHRNDTKVYADGILGLVQKNEALERFDAALDCRVTKLEVRVSSLAPRTRGTK